MIWVLYVLGALIGALLLAYMLAPAMLLGGLYALARRKAGLARKLARFDGAEWPYLEGGNPAGPPLMMVHGFGGDKDNWTMYAPWLTARYRLICPDLPAFGEAPADPTRDHSGVAQAEWLARFMTALGVERAHVGGNSMGGYIALLFTLAHPARVTSLTLVNNAGALGAHPSELQVMVEANPAASPLVPRDLADTRRLMDFVVARPRPMPAGFLKVFLARFQARAGLLDSVFARLVDDMLNHPLNARLGEVTAPTLIIWGRHDRLIDVSCAEAQHQGIAGSELVVFDDLGHVPMIEAPRRMAMAQLDFLNRQ
ncbi:MAG: alpha/beta fold hydrolase [Proteobacteria bacterium]|nr:alpha/beta fold hydrolase [Pseudomonadota bacterium]